MTNKELPGRVEIYSIIKNIQIREMQKGLKVNQYILDEIYEAVNKRIQEAIKESE